MKKILMVIMICGLLLSMVGCGSKEKNTESSTEEIKFSVSDISDKLTGELKYEDSLTQIDSAKGAKYYGIDASIIADSAVYISTGATAEEVAVFEATSEADADTIYNACVARKDAQTTSYKDYKADELDRLENAIIKKNDVYVVYCVSNDKAAAQEIIDGFLK